MHDENGNVDPVKASEIPIPRGSVMSKKRSIGEDGSPLEIKKPKLNDGQPPPRAQTGTAGVLMPQHVSQRAARPSPVQPASRPPPPVINEPPPDPQQQPEIDPSLFSVYPEPAEQGPYGSNSYPYPTTEQAQTHQYEYPSLEQIANEVLDMNGRGHEDYIDAQLNALPNTLPYQPPYNPAHANVHVYEAQDAAPGPNVSSKPDESVDSAISLPNTESHTRDRSVDERLRDAFAADSDAGVYHGLPAVQPSVEANGATQPVSVGPKPTASPRNNDASGLPLYRPPAPVSQSPEQTKRQPIALVNGAADIQKRKRESMSATPSAKKVKLDVEGRASREPSVQETDDERIARLMQQEELGLRRRSSK